MKPLFTDKTRGYLWSTRLPGADTDADARAQITELLCDPRHWSCGRYPATNRVQLYFDPPKTSPLVTLSGAVLTTELTDDGINPADATALILDVYDGLIELWREHGIITDIIDATYTRGSLTVRPVTLSKAFLAHTQPLWPAISPIPVLSVANSAIDDLARFAHSKPAARSASTFDGSTLTVTSWRDYIAHGLITDPNEPFDDYVTLWTVNLPSTSGVFAPDPYNVHLLAHLQKPAKSILLAPRRVNEFDYVAPIDDQYQVLVSKSFQLNRAVICPTYSYARKFLAVYLDRLAALLGKRNDETMKYLCPDLVQSLQRYLQAHPDCTAEDVQNLCDRQSPEGVVIDAAALLA